VYLVVSSHNLVVDHRCVCVCVCVCVLCVCVCVCVCVVRVRVRCIVFLHPPCSPPTRLSGPPRRTNLTTLTTSWMMRRKRGAREAAKKARRRRRRRTMTKLRLMQLTSPLLLSERCCVVLCDGYVFETNVVETSV